MIVLRTPKGWTGPSVVDGVQVEGTFRSHQVPLAGLADNPEHLRLLEEWMRSYRPDELFDDGRPAPEIAALSPVGDRRMGATPYANGGRLRTDLDLARLPRRRGRRARARRRTSCEPDRGVWATGCATSSRATRRRSASWGPTRRRRTA